MQSRSLNMGSGYLKARRRIKVVANGELTLSCPAGYYWDSLGVLYAIKITADVNTTRLGVPQVTIDDTESGYLTISGLVTLTSGGTADQLVTGISNAGAITDAAVSNANADINVLGVSVDATSMYLY